MTTLRCCFLLGVLVIGTVKGDCAPGCENGGSCVSAASGAWECRCRPGFRGRRCQLAQCDPTPCLHGGDCEPYGPNGFICACPHGWKGKRCEVPVDECQEPGSFCANGGTCSSSGCRCVGGWGGVRCEEDVDECGSGAELCLHGGLCVNEAGGFSCACVGGWEGELCERDANDCAAVAEPCANGGTCVDHRGNYACTCPIGFIGTRCELKDPCYNSPCGNGAACGSSAEDGSYVCVCPDTFRGRHCEEDVDECAEWDENHCDNGAECRNTQGDFRCLCTPGWTGRWCDEVVHACATKPCHNGAECLDQAASFLCLCTKGFSGKHCDEPIAAQAISNGLAGITELCSSEFCENGGHCRLDPKGRRSCDCGLGFEGPRCRDRKKNCIIWPCQNGGTCRAQGERCECAEGFAGERCLDLATSEGALPGDLLVTVLQSPAAFFAHKDHFLRAMGELLSAHVTVKRRSHPPHLEMIFYWDSVEGKGAIFRPSSGARRRRSAESGTLVALGVDCAGGTAACPTDVKEAARRLEEEGREARRMGFPLHSIQARLPRHRDIPGRFQKWEWALLVVIGVLALALVSIVVFTIVSRLRKRKISVAGTYFPPVAKHKTVNGNCVLDMDNIDSAYIKKPRLSNNYDELDPSGGLRNFLEPHNPDKRQDTLSRRHAGDAFDSVPLDDAPGPPLSDSMLRAGARADAEVLRRLLQDGGNPNQGDAAGNSVIHLLAASTSPDAVRALGVLLLRGRVVIVDARNAKGETALVVAAKTDCKTSPDIVRLLLKHKADYTASDANDCVESGKVMLETAMSVDLQTEADETALFLAAREGSQGMVELLLGHGADKDIADELGRTPLDIARDRSQHRIAKFLEMAPPKPKAPTLIANSPMLRHKKPVGSKVVHDYVSYGTQFEQSGDWSVSVSQAVSARPESGAFVRYDGSLFHSTPQLDWGPTEPPPKRRPPPTSALQNILLHPMPSQTFTVVPRRTYVPDTSSSVLGGAEEVQTEAEVHSKPRRRHKRRKGGLVQPVATYCDPYYGIVQTDADGPDADTTGSFSVALSWLDDYRSAPNESTEPLPDMVG